MDPNVDVQLSVSDLLKAIITFVILLPCMVIYRTTSWLLSPKLDRRPLKDVLGRPLVIGLACYIPVSIIQYIGRTAGWRSDLFKSKRYAQQRNQIFSRVQRPKFAGYWICRGLGEEPIAIQDADIVVFYIHGGAYIIGWPAMDASQLLYVAELAAQEGLSMACFALEYSHAPGALLPEILIQARAAYEWLIHDQGIPATKISIIGESAGGHLVLSLLTDLHLRPAAISLSSLDSLPQGQILSKPAFAFLHSPWIDLFNSNPRVRNIKDFQKSFKTFFNMCADMVLGSTPDHFRGLFENFALPVKGRGNWKDILPSITWVSGGSEEPIFIEDIRDFVALAERDGAKVFLEVHEGGEHCWQNADARTVRKTFLASEPSMNDEGLMPGYRALAKKLVRPYREK